MASAQTSQRAGKCHFGGPIHALYGGFLSIHARKPTRLTSTYQ
jgi:hypothetical protein